MRTDGQNSESESRRADDAGISRRMVVSSSGLAFLGLVTNSGLGQEEIDEEARRKVRERLRAEAQEAGRRASEAAFQRSLERDPQLRAFYEQVGSGATMEERAKAMQDWQRKQSLENLKNQLGVSEEEWTVIQPRLETVFRLTHPPAPFPEEDMGPSAIVARITRESWELLNKKDVKPEEIKAKLTVLRAAKEQVRQELSKAQRSLRQIMTIRQEAVLVLSGLLD